MELKEYKGDLLQSGADIICHQVNCLGIMGGGIAKQIREKYPSVYNSYRALCKKYQDNPESLLGNVQLLSLPLPNGRRIANIFGQCYCGGDKRYTDYDAVQKAVSKLAFKVNGYQGIRVGFPKYFGCGLAGGDWNIVSNIIIEAFQDTDAIVEFWEF